jgi:hypothetical protein
MKQWKFAIAGLALLVGGCHHNQSSTTAFIEKPISTRPIVAITSVIDHSRHELSWNISKELTRAIRQQLVQHNQLYLLSEDQIYALSRKAPQEDAFGTETLWIKKAYSQNEFVAFFELMDHRETPLPTAEGAQNNAENNESPAQLNISMRVRVFDLRGEQPKVVLQEIVEQSHHIPKQFTQNQLNQVPWGDETFEISPLGLAHEKLCQEISSRVEDYILLNCVKK